MSEADYQAEQANKFDNPAEQQRNLRAKVDFKSILFSLNICLFVLFLFIFYFCFFFTDDFFKISGTFMEYFNYFPSTPLSPYNGIKFIDKLFDIRGLFEK